MKKLNFKAIFCAIAIIAITVGICYASAPKVTTGVISASTAAGLFVFSVSDAKTEKERIDGQASREYVTITFIDKLNPFSDKCYIRNIFQSRLSDGTVKWRATSPEKLKSIEGKIINGCMISTKEVHPYTFTGSNGNEVVCNKFTLALLPHESTSEVSEMQAFRAQGHPLITDAPLVAVEQSHEVVAENAELRAAI